MKTSQTPWYQKHGLTHHRTWYLKNREKVLAKRKEKYRKLSSDPNYRTLINLKRKHLKEKYRAFAITHYGGACVCCNEKMPEFLCFDHINGEGGKERKSFLRGRSMGIWLKKQGYPKTFRLLCHNCNAARAFYGYCPHQDKSRVMY